MSGMCCSPFKKRTNFDDEWIRVHFECQDATSFSWLHALHGCFCVGFGWHCQHLGLYWSCYTRHKTLWSCGSTSENSGNTNLQPTAQNLLLIDTIFTIYIYIYMYIEPQWPLFLKVNPPKTRPLPIKTRGPIWVLGVYKSVLISYPKNPIPSLLRVPTLSSGILGVIPVRGYSWIHRVILYWIMVSAEIVLHLIRWCPFHYLLRIG